jgi:hypothetical protein
VPPSSLAWLSAQLGGDVLHIEAAPSGTDVRLADLVLYDPLVRPVLHAGDLILAIGVSPQTSDAVDLLKWGAASGAGAGVFKMDAPCPERLRLAAEEFGIAVLVIPPEMAWDQFYALSRRLLDTAADWPNQPSPLPLGDVFALADAIATMVGGPVIVDNPRMQVIAYSNVGGPIDDLRRQSILARSAPDEVMRRLVDEGVIRSIMQSPGAVRLPEWAGTRPRWGVAIRAGKEILGLIFVAEGDRELGPETEGLLVDASRIAALHLLHLRSSDDIERRMRADLLRGVLEDRGSAELLASQLRIDSVGSFSILAVQPSSPWSETDEGPLRAGRLRDLVSLQGEAIWKHSVAVPTGETTYVLLPGAEVLPATRLVRLAQELVERVQQALGLSVLVGLGTTVTHLGQLARSRREADQVLHLLRTQLRDRSIAAFDDVRPHAFLLELQNLSSVREHIEHGKVAALRAHDSAHGSQYIDTLRAYLQSLGDVALASRAVHVHPNTLRYRLRRLSELIDLNLDDPVERLVAELHLHLL